MSDPAVPRPAPCTEPAGLVSGLLLAVVVGGGLSVTAREGAVSLLAGVAVVQVLLVLGWVFGLRLPGAKGSGVVALLAAVASDVVVTHWPHGRLGTLLAVLGLAVPVLFIQQLVRGAARVRVVESMAGSALLVVAVVGVAAFVQLRHEFEPGGVGDKVAAAAVAAAAGGLVVAHLVDLIAPVPRFDPDAPRGLLAVVAAALVGGGVGYLLLRHQSDFPHGRSLFVGAACGLLAALLAVAGSFAVRSVPAVEGRWRGRIRDLVTVPIALAILAPAAFLLCLAIRT